MAIFTFLKSVLNFKSFVPPMTNDFIGRAKTIHILTAYCKRRMETEGKAKVVAGCLGGKTALARQGIDQSVGRTRAENKNRDGP